MQLPDHRLVPPSRSGSSIQIDGCQLTINRQIQMRILRRKTRQTFPSFLPESYTSHLQIQNDNCRSQHASLRSWYAIPCATIYSTLECISSCCRFFLCRCIYHSFCHRMRKMLFQAGSNTKQLIRVLTVRRIQPLLRSDVPWSVFRSYQIRWYQLRPLPPRYLPPFTVHRDGCLPHGSQTVQRSA